MSTGSYEGAPPLGGSGSEQRAVILAQPRRAEQPNEAVERLTSTRERVALSISGPGFTVPALPPIRVDGRGFSLHCRMRLAELGLIADGPELFGDLAEREPADPLGRSVDVSCAANDRGPAPVRVWSNGEAKATEREDGELDLVVADGIADNRRYRLTRRIG